MTAADQTQLEKSDFSGGAKLPTIADGAMLTGHVDDTALVRRGDELSAVRAKCTCYEGPLGEGRKKAVAVIHSDHEAEFARARPDGPRAPSSSQAHGGHLKP